MKATHPKGLYLLFLTEMWERFSFYGMRALLMLYMTKQLLYSDAVSYGLWGAYGALVYASPFIGGMVADRFLGYRRAIIFGGIVMALGHFCMAVPLPLFFYGALALLCVGNGFFKPNISSLVGKLYPAGDPRRDSGFTIFYMGINIGAFLAPLICGLVGERFGWHYGFGLAGIGMLIGLGVFLYGQKLLAGHGTPPQPELLRRPLFGPLTRLHGLYAACIVAVPLIALALLNNTYVKSILYVAAVAIFAFLFYTAFSSKKAERDRLLVLMVLMVFHTLFWAFVEQGGSSFLLFADRNVDRHIFGWAVRTSQVPALNPLFIILFAPVFARLWIWLQKVGRQPSIPVKFFLAFVQASLGFAVLVVGSYFVKEGILSFGWLIFAYLLHTTGELSIAPVGLSAITKLAPAKVVGTVMGAWFLSISFAFHMAGVIAKLAALPQKATLKTLVDPLQSLGVYMGLYRSVGWWTLAAAAVLLLLTPFLKRMMHEVE